MVPSNPLPVVVRRPALAICAFLFSVIPGHAAPSPDAPILPLGGPALSGWSGVTSDDQAAHAQLPVPGETVFRYPDGPKGATNHGFRRINDSAADWHTYSGIKFDVELTGGEPVVLTVSLLPYGAERPAEWIQASVRLRGSGWQTVSLPWSAFQFEKAWHGFLQAVKAVRITANPGGEKSAPIRLRDVRVVKGERLALDTPVQGKSAPAGDTVEYAVTVGNATAEPQAVTLQFSLYGWEAMQSKVSPSSLDLAPGESKTATVTVRIPDTIPPGGHEIQTLQAIPGGDAANAATLELITASALPHPYILHTPKRWQEVRDRMAGHEWAKKAAEEVIAKADKYQVPEIARPPHNDPNDNGGPFLFRTQNEHDLMACGTAWQLTGNPRYAEKIKTFLLRLSDPKDGYPKTLRGCNQSFVQEGHFFQHIAMAYDMVLPSGLFSGEEQAQIAATFREYMKSVALGNTIGAINNWNISEIVGAFYCALVLQDLSAADHFFAGPSGITDQLARGTMDDGWWYECSIGYNVWCASEFTQVALAYEPWGVNFADMWIPASYAREAILSAPGGSPQLSGGKVQQGISLNSLARPFGMSKEIWGPLRRPYRRIQDLWNSLLPFLDYRGVMFGVNDSAENNVVEARQEAGGQPFEIAYYVYRDPAYASVIRRGDGTRDLLYGVPDLPEETPEPFRDSAFADNVGVVMLRSQTGNRPIRDQIQAVLHYGTHGWAHGHFDRTSLLSLMRYGRSFFNPEMVWYGYASHLYKFYVQTSVAKNMVVVDRKMQEATESDRVLFHTGSLMQATVVESESRWSNPPYGGMVYDYIPVDTFEEKLWQEGRYVPIPENAPAYGSLTDFTEPVLQRRAMVVADDYVVLADYVKGGREHTYESLFQMKGFQGLDAPEKKLLRHDAQWNSDPLGSAQFVTDCDWHSVAAPAKLSFRMKFGPGADNAGTRTIANEDGILDLDVYSLWPPKQEIMIATAPEDHDVKKRLFYTIRGDGREIAGGKFAPWILGKADIDIPVEGIKSLELETRTELAKNPTLFWANARIQTAGGKEIPLSELPASATNVTPAKGPGLDYKGGPVKIVGEAYENAVAAEPKNAAEPAILTIDLGGIDAVRFQATLGGDYPPGPETQRRKTVAIRENGSEARFLSVIEPSEGKPVIDSVEALSADKLRVSLKDGRVQEITLRNFEGNAPEISIDMTESKNGKLIRSESSAKPNE